MATPATATPRGASAARASSKDADQARYDYQTMWSNMQQAQQKTDDTEVRAVCDQLLEALALRARYLPGPTGVPGADGGADRTRSAELPFEPPPWDGKAYRHEMRGGVMHVHAWEPEAGDVEPDFEPPPTIEAYTRDLTRLIQICGDAAVNSFCHRRLQKLEALKPLAPALALALVLAVAVAVAVAVAPAPAPAPALALALSRRASSCT